MSQKITVEDKVVTPAPDPFPLWEGAKRGIPNLNDSFIVNSPSETGDGANSLLNYLISQLSHLLALQIIVAYLITMLIIIFTCKVIIDNNVNLD